MELGQFYRRLHVNTLADVDHLVDRKNFGMDGLDLMKLIPDESIPLVYFDPQYDHLLQFMKYGNRERQKGRHALKAMNAMCIFDFGQEIARILQCGCAGSAETFSRRSTTRPLGPPANTMLSRSAI
jgi:hypothetical protein